MGDNLKMLGVWMRPTDYSLTQTKKSTLIRCVDNFEKISHIIDWRENELRDLMNMKQVNNNGRVTYRSCINME